MKRSRCATFFWGFPRFGSLRHLSPKEDLRKTKLLEDRMKTPMAGPRVHDQNHSKNKKWPIIFFFPDNCWVKELSVIQKSFQTKSTPTTSIVRRVLRPSSSHPKSWFFFSSELKVQPDEQNPRARRTKLFILQGNNEWHSNKCIGSYNEESRRSGNDFRQGAVCLDASIVGSVRWHSLHKYQRRNKGRRVDTSPVAQNAVKRRRMDTVSHSTSHHLEGL